MSRAGDSDRLRLYPRICVCQKSATSRWWRRVSLEISIGCCWHLGRGSAHRGIHCGLYGRTVVTLTARPCQWTDHRFLGRRGQPAPDDRKHANMQIRLCHGWEPVPGGSLPLDSQVPVAVAGGPPHEHETSHTWPVPGPGGLGLHILYTGEHSIWGTEVTWVMVPQSQCCFVHL